VYGTVRCSGNNLESFSRLRPSTGDPSRGFHGSPQSPQTNIRAALYQILPVNRSRSPSHFIQCYTWPNLWNLNIKVKYIISHKSGYISGRDRNFFSLPTQPHQLRNPISLLSNGHRGLFNRGTERPERESDRQLPSNVDVKNVWSYTALFPYVFMSCLYVTNRSQIDNCVEA